MFVGIKMHVYSFKCSRNLLMQTNFYMKIGFSIHTSKTGMFISRLDNDLGISTSTERRIK